MIISIFWHTQQICNTNICFLIHEQNGNSLSRNLIYIYVNFNEPINNLIWAQYNFANSSQLIYIICTENFVIGTKQNVALEKINIA